jgi:hypothetical protein
MSLYLKKKVYIFIFKDLYFYVHTLDEHEVRVTSRPAVYRPSVRFGAKPLEDHDQRFYLQLRKT